jgi:hypothetical protein
VDRSGPLRRLKSIDRGNSIARAQDLHERMFGERANFDLGKLSLRQQQILNQQSQAIEKATLNRARYQDGIRRNLSAAAATEQLAVVDRSSPKL